MIRILVINTKGGCGKTTVATNLASAYANAGHGTVLFDCDPQGSAMRWLRQRPESLPIIHGIAAYQSGPMNVTRTWQLRVPADTQRIIIDSPPGLKGRALAEQVRNIDVIIVPVVPSPIDMFSTADFIRDLMLIGKIRLPRTRVGIVANRIKPNTLSFQSLERFLHRLNIPVVAKLRDTQNYVHAVDQGVSIHELASSRAEKDKHTMMEILRWIESSQRPNLALVEPIKTDAVSPQTKGNIG